MYFIKYEKGPSAPKYRTAGLIALMIVFLCIGNGVRAQIQQKNKNVTKMLCFLDGEIIYDPDTSMTVQALIKIDNKTLENTKYIEPKTALKLYGERGRAGVFHMFTKKDAASMGKNGWILHTYSRVYHEDKFPLFKKDFPNDSLMDCRHPQPDDVFPSYPGGVQGISQFIASSLKYPPLAMEHQISGKVIIGFIIREDGTLTDLKPIAGVDLGAGLAEEALRLVQTLPRFFPGSRDHKPIKTFYCLPINFVIASQFTPDPAN